MENGKPDPWKMLRKRFKQFDQVVVITTEDEYMYGAIEFLEGKEEKKKFHLIGCNGGVKTKEIEWADVEVINRECFSVRKLLTYKGDGEKLIDKLEVTDENLIIKESLIKELCYDCGAPFLTGKACGVCESTRGISASWATSIGGASITLGSYVGKAIGNSSGVATTNVITPKAVKQTKAFGNFIKWIQSNKKGGK